MNPNSIVVDANIVFQCLRAGRGDLRERIGPDSHAKFYSPLFLFVELFIIFVVWRHGFTRADLHALVFFQFIIVAQVLFLWKRPATNVSEFPANTQARRNLFAATTLICLAGVVCFQFKEEAIFTNILQNRNLSFSK